MDIHSYVDLTLKIMPSILTNLAVEMKKFTDKIDQSSPPSDPFAFMGMFMETFMSVLSGFSADFELYGTTAEEFNSYGNQHKAELESLCKQDPAIKKKIDNFKSQLTGITESFKAMGFTKVEKIENSTETSMESDSIKSNQKKTSKKSSKKSS